MTEKLGLSIAETAELMGICKETVRKMALRDELPTWRIGRRIIIKRLALEQMMAESKPKEAVNG